MPDDGHGTDERLAAPVKRKSDFEAQLAAGCMTIGIVSLATYFLIVGPFTLIPEHTRAGLASILALGALPALVAGAVVSRRFALAGATGFFGGSMAAAVFMYLRLHQTFVVEGDPNFAIPEYPRQVMVWLPLGWFVASGLVALVFCRREQGEH